MSKFFEGVGIAVVWLAIGFVGARLGVAFDRCHQNPTPTFFVTLMGPAGLVSAVFIGAAESYRSSPCRCTTPRTEEPPT